MSSNDAIDRFNKYKSRMDNAGTQVIRKFLHLVRPTEGFPASSPYEIQMSYNEWKEEEECFYRMTGSDLPPQRIFPKPPAADAPRSCWRMWGLLIQQQVERIDQSELIKLCVADIMASPPCRQADCPCKVSNNPWTSYHEVAALAPLNVEHNPRCHCAGYQMCAKKQGAASVIEKPAKEKAHVPNCACGVCFWEREAKEGRYPPESSPRPAVSSGATSPIGAILQAAQKADAVISKALACSTGGIDMAKDIFASMGTPFDSKCPHGLPFYACMPCSH